LVARIADDSSGEQTFSTLPAERHNRGVVLWQSSSCRAAAIMSKIRNAKYQIGQVVRHRLYPFRGVVFDIDPTFSNTEEWYEAIPAEIRPHKDQPFYHLFAENEETEYIAYVSEQNLLPDNSGEPVRHPQVAEVFVQDGEGYYRPRSAMMH
jgi:heat shock protein HspQ